MNYDKLNKVLSLSSSSYTASTAYGIRLEAEQLIRAYVFLFNIYNLFIFHVFTFSTFFIFFIECFYVYG